MATTDKKLLEQQLVETPLQPDVVTPNYSGYIIPSTGTSMDNQNAANGQQNTQQNTQQSTPQNTQTGTGQQTTAPDMSGLISLPGVSDTTKQALGSLISNGYQPSQNVASAMQQLQDVIAKQPAAFQSQYQQQLNNIMATIMGRQQFSYDLSTDPMYQQYKQQYMNMGKQAMEDTMGQAATLTGGYGSSYAATAGQQQYNQHLQQLMERAPELYQLARDAYNAEGEDLKWQYGMALDAYNQEYGQYQDQYDRWLAERDYAQGNYDQQLNFWQDQAAMEQDQANVDRDYFYDLAMNMLDRGIVPSADILRKAGLSDADIAALRAGGISGGSGGSSRKSGGKSSTSKLSSTLSNSSKASDLSKKAASTSLNSYVSGNSKASGLSGKANNSTASLTNLLLKQKKIAH